VFIVVVVVVVVSTALVVVLMTMMVMPMMMMITMMMLMMMMMMMVTPSGALPAGERPVPGLAAERRPLSAQLEKPLFRTSQQRACLLCG
jgi:hypothetical protein